MRMLRESSMRIATAFFCGTAVETSSVGRSSAKPASATTATRTAVSTARSRGVLFPRARRYAHASTTPIAATATMISIGQGAASAKSPRSKTTGRYLKRVSTNASIQRRASLRRKPRGVEPRNDPQRVLVVDLLEHLVRQIEAVHLPERVAPAVVIEVFVSGLEHAEVRVVLGGLIAVLPEEHAVLVLRQKLSREAWLTSQLGQHGADLGVHVRQRIHECTEMGEIAA